MDARESLAASRASHRICALRDGQPRVWAPSGCPHHGPLRLDTGVRTVGHGDGVESIYETRASAHASANHQAYGLRSKGTRETVLPKPSMLETVPHPSGNTDGRGIPLHAFTETFMRHARAVHVLPDHRGPDVQVFYLCRGGVRTPVDVDAGASSMGAAAHVMYIRETSEEWALGLSCLDDAVAATRSRVDERASTGRTDGSTNADSPSAGVYVNTGSSSRVPPVGTRTKACPRGPQHMAEVGRWVPFRHSNACEPGVQAVIGAVAPIMGAAARVMSRHIPHAMDGMTEPVRDCDAIGELFVLPSTDMQTCVRKSEFGPLVRDKARCPEPIALKLQHVAARLSGLPLNATAECMELACMGLSNHHIDSVDSERRHGVPIIYWPRVVRQSPPARRMRSADLVLGEGPAGRLWRIRTCVPGYVCIVCAHYESMVHGNVYPDRGGSIYDPRGDLLLASQLEPGLELLRLVCYSLKTIDSFVEAFQRTYEVLNGVDREHLLLALLDRLDPPLSSRLLQMYPHLR